MPEVLLSRLPLTITDYTLMPVFCAIKNNLQACFYSGFWACGFSDLQARGQLAVAPQRLRIGGGAGGKFFHFLLPSKLDELIENAAHFGPVALNTFGDL